MRESGCGRDACLPHPWLPGIPLMPMDENSMPLSPDIGAGRSLILNLQIQVEVW